MLVKPITALTGVPSLRVSGGIAWKARKMKPEPSTRYRASAVFSAATGSADAVRAAAGDVSVWEASVMGKHIAWSGVPVDMAVNCGLPESLKTDRDCVGDNVRVAQ